MLSLVRNFWLILFMFTACVLLLTAFFISPPQNLPAVNASNPQDEEPSASGALQENFGEDGLALNGSQTLVRPIQASEVATFKIGLQWNALAPESGLSQLNLRFRTDENAIYLIETIRKETDSRKKITINAITTRAEDSASKILASITLDSAQAEELTVQFRFGLIQILVAGEHQLFADTNQYDARVTGVELTGEGAAIRTLAISLDNSNNRKSTPSGEPSENTEALGNEMVLAYQAGKYPEAIQACEKWIDANILEFGIESIPAINSKRMLVGLYTAMGRVEEAIKTRMEVAELTRKVVGQVHPVHAEVVEEFAAYSLNSRQLDLSSKLLQEAREVYEQLYGPNHSKSVGIIFLNGTLEEQSGNLGKAEQLWLHALSLTESLEGKQSINGAARRIPLAALYVRKGDIVAAKGYAEEALSNLQALSQEDTDQYKEVLGILSSLYSKEGDFQKAVLLQQEVVDYFAKQNLQSAPSHAAALGNLGEMQLAVGDTFSAEQSYLKALEIFQRTPSQFQFEISVILNGLAGVYRQTNRLTDAEEKLQESLAILKQFSQRSPSFYYISLNNLAAFYEQTLQLEKAEEYYIQAKDGLLTTLGERHTQYAAALNNLGNLYMKMGQFNRAEGLFEESIRIRNSIFGDRNLESALVINNLGILKLHQGDKITASELFIKSVDIQKSHIDRVSYVQSVRQQELLQTKLRNYLDFIVSLDANNDQEMERYLQYVWDWKGAVMARQHAYRSIARTPKINADFERLRNLATELSSLASQPPQPPSNQQDDEAVSRYDALLAAWRQKVLDSRTSLEQIEQQIAGESKSFRLVRTPLTVSTVRNRLPAKTALVDFLEYSHSEPDKDIKGQLSSERRFLAFVVRSDRAPVMVRLPSAKEVVTAVQQMRLPFEKESSEPINAEAKQAEIWLRENLWLPIESYLTGVETIVISPDTILATLPFSALPGREKGEYLLENYRLCTLSTSSQLSQIFDQDGQPERPSLGKLLIVGDIDYDADPTERYEGKSSFDADLVGIRNGNIDGDPNASPVLKKITGAKNEMEAILASYKANTPVTEQHFEILSGSNVTADAVLDAVASSNIAHVITHGYYQDTSAKPTDGRMNPRSVHFGEDGPKSIWLPSSLSGLALSKANAATVWNASESGAILRSTQIESQPMNGVELVVLSACQSGLGLETKGDGLLGLQRSFHIAGARSVVATLWEVRDNATAQLMSEFYRNLLEKRMSKIDALRESQLTVMKNYEPVFGEPNRGVIKSQGKVEPQNVETKSHPRYWAGFTLSGDWR